MNAMIGQMVLCQMEIFAGIEQRLARDASHIQAYASRTALFFYTGHLHSQLRCPNSRYIAARTGTDDHKVERFFGCHFQISTMIRSGDSTHSLIRFRKDTASLPSTIR